MIKSSGLSHMSENQSDTRIDWFMLQKIYNMYIDIKKNKRVILMCYSYSYQNMKNNKSKQRT